MRRRTGPNDDEVSPFGRVDAPTISDLETERSVRYLLVAGLQDDGPWGPIGAVWLSGDGDRGGFLVHPWAIERGTDMVRGYRGALARGFTPSMIYEYWATEPWTSSVIVDEEREASTLVLVNELLNVL